MAANEYTLSSNVISVAEDTFNRWGLLESRAQIRNTIGIIDIGITLVIWPTKSLNVRLLILRLSMSQVRVYYMHQSGNNDLMGSNRFINSAKEVE